MMRIDFMFQLVSDVIEGDDVRECVRVESERGEALPFYISRAPERRTNERERESERWDEFFLSILFQLSASVYSQSAADG